MVVVSEEADVATLAHYRRALHVACNQKNVSEARSFFYMKSPSISASAFAALPPFAAPASASLPAPASASAQSAPSTSPTSPNRSDVENGFFMQRRETDRHRPGRAGWPPPPLADLQGLQPRSP
mmetsp:Transcript_6091/g.15567  ORF Transcript_6091/g.15567 Transcript_6091/m.15567 type:complete len:124 (-) Transcript_6091:357-728(-)